jgi:hypothetical protein
MASGNSSRVIATSPKFSVSSADNVTRPLKDLQKRLGNTYVFMRPAHGRKHDGGGVSD